MLRYLKMKNVGPTLDASISFSTRLNIITGDNGLGKSFLLDIVWWAMTSWWPAEVNAKLNSGFMGTPAKDGDASVMFKIDAKGRSYEYKRIFDRNAQTWKPEPYYAHFSPEFMDLVLYAQADGSFSVWDPARNGWKHQEDNEKTGRIPAYVFNTTEVWEGLRNAEGKLLFNGLITDWSGWQKENGEEFQVLCSVLKELSPEGESLEPGPLTRISLDDPRDIPTIKMSYGVNVPLPQASSGIRRIISMAYMLVWAWSEHYKACTFLKRETVNQVTFLVDEIEAHLHPKWQRLIVNSLLNVNKKLSVWPNVQLIASTHSPMVMASLEQIFDRKTDSWFDLDYVEENQNLEKKVAITNRSFHKKGNASDWLVSEAFDLEYATSYEAELVLKKASELLSSDQQIDESIVRSIDKDLRRVLGETNPFWIRWTYIAKKKGWHL